MNNQEIIVNTVDRSTHRESVLRPYRTAPPGLAGLNGQIVISSLTLAIVTQLPPGISHCSQPNVCPNCG